MNIFPAIDIRGGQCVRLVQGRAHEATRYGEPLEMAHRWRNAGAQFLHVVDLDGAFTGSSQNMQIVSRIAKETAVLVQLGGGIRTMEDIDRRLDSGVWRVVLGTAAIEDPALVRAATSKYPGRIACGIDVKDGFVVTRGWVQKSAQTALQLGVTLKDMGVSTVIYTNVSNDGMLSGVDASGTQDLIEETGLEVIASGGVGSLSDIIHLHMMGVQGVIVGKALYENRFSLEEAILVAK